MDYHWEWSEDIMIGIALTPLYFKQKMEELIEQKNIYFHLEVTKEEKKGVTLSQLSN